VAHEGDRCDLQPETVMVLSRVPWSAVAKSGFASSVIWLTIPAFFFLEACGARSPGSYVDKGNQLLAEGKAADASLNYRRAIQKDPNFGEAYYRLGLALIRLERPVEALPAFERAARLMPARRDIKVAAADLSLAVLLAGADHTVPLRNRIVVISDQLLAEDPRSYDALRLKGHLANQDLNFTDAERYFRMANESKPMQPEVITGWMQALFRKGQSAEAEKLGWQLIGANKTYGPVYDQLYSYYRAANQLAEAETILKTKVENNPFAPQPVLQLAAFYGEQSQSRKMQAALQRLLDNPKRFPQAYLQVGDFYVDRRKWDESINQYRAGAEANPQDRIIYLKRIVDLWLAQDQPDKAAPVVAEILARNPEDDSAKAVNASLVMARGKPEDIAAAVAQFKALVNKNPDNAVWRYAYGRALAAQGDFEGARNQQQEAIRRQPGFLLPHLAMGEIFQSQGDFRNALDYANQSLAIDADSPAARLLHAVSLMHMGMLADASQEFALLEKAYPGERKIQVQLALLDLKKSRLAPAEDRFRKLVAENPGDVSAQSGLVEVLGARGRLADAVPLLQQALDGSPQADGVRSLLADTALRLGDADLALATYRHLADSQPSLERSYLGLGLAYRQKLDLANAVANFQRAAALAPNDSVPVVLLAQTLVGTGRISEAIVSYRHALELRPGSAAIMNDLAYEIAETGSDLDEALELAQKALKKNDRQPQFMDTMGWVYYKKHMTESAVQIFRNLTDKYPGSPIYRYHLGLALSEKGDRQKAKSELRMALSEDPSPELRREIEAALQIVR
jgi:tetratricopeptide (TPR) repeat protein